MDRGAESHVRSWSHEWCGGGGRHVALTFAIIVCVVVEVVSFVSVVVFVHIYFFSDVSRTMSRLCP